MKCFIFGLCIFGIFAYVSGEADYSAPPSRRSKNFFRDSYSDPDFGQTGQGPYPERKNTRYEDTLKNSRFVKNPSGEYGAPPAQETEDSRRNRRPIANLRKPLRNEYGAPEEEATSAPDQSYGAPAQETEESRRRRLNQRKPLRNEYGTPEEEATSPDQSYGAPAQETEESRRRRLNQRKPLRNGYGTPEEETTSAPDQSYGAPAQETEESRRRRLNQRKPLRNDYGIPEEESTSAPDQSYGAPAQETEESRRRRLNQRKPLRNEYGSPAEETAPAPGDSYGAPERLLLKNMNRGQILQLIRTLEAYMRTRTRNEGGYEDSQQGSGQGYPESSTYGPPPEETEEGYSRSRIQSKKPGRREGYEQPSQNYGSPAEESPAPTGEESPAGAGQPEQPSETDDAILQPPARRAPRNQYNRNFQIRTL